MTEVDRPVRDRVLLLRVARLFRCCHGAMGLLIVTILASAAVGLASPLLTGLVFDRALFPPSGTPDLSQLYRLVALMAALPLLAGSIHVLQAYLANRTALRILQGLRERLYDRLQGMPLAFFTGTRLGEIQSRFANDVGGLRAVVTETVPSVIADTLVLSTTLIAMLLISWRLTLVSVLLVPLFAVLTARVGRRRQVLTAEAQSSMARLSAIVDETLGVSGILLAKLFGRRAAEVARYRAESARLAALQLREQMTGELFVAVIQTYFAITPAVVYLVAGITIVAGTGEGLSAGTLIAFVALEARLFFPLGQMLELATEIRSSLALFRRVFEYLDLEPAITDSADAVELPKERVSGAVRLRNVWFHHGAPPGRRHGAEGSGAAGDQATTGHHWALRGVDLTIRPGQFVALVGPSGAGKTTLCHLVARLHDVVEGRVELDGIDVRRIKLSSLTQAVGVVTQESYLFHASVRENLRYARPAASDEDLEAAARLANLHDRIVRLERGYDTIVGERGHRFSGGERQRLAIARLVLKDPRVVILDEATASLDSATEHTIQLALRALLAGRTTIVIAHRLSTIVSAELIIVLDNGRVVEQGTHAELLERSGLYAKLYRAQNQELLGRATPSPSWR